MTIPVREQPVKPQTQLSRRTKMRNRIMEHALEEFAAHGFAGASVRDIAGSAGINHSLVRYYFKDKENLWKEAVSYLHEQMYRELAVHDSEAQSEDPLERLKDFVRRYVWYCAKHPEHARIMVQEATSDTHLLQWVSETFTRPNYEAFTRGHEHLVAQGLLPDIPPYAFTYILTSAAQTIFMLAPEVRHVLGFDIQQDEHIERHADAIIALFFDRSAKAPQHPEL